MDAKYHFDLILVGLELVGPHLVDHSHGCHNKHLYDVVYDQTLID